jgi:hypothetical protein
MAVALAEGALACSSSHPASPAPVGFAAASPSDDAGAQPDVYLLPPAWDGGSPKELASGITAVSIAADDQNVYLQSAGGGVYACPITGCAKEDAATQLSALIGGSSQLQTLVANNGAAFFITQGGNSISRVAYAAPTKTSTVYIASQGGVDAIVTDGASLFFVDDAYTDGGDASTSVAILSCPLSGSCTSPTVLYSKTQGDNYVTFSALAAAGDRVYFLEVEQGANGESSNIKSIPSQGGSARTVCATGPSDVYGIESLAVAAGYAFFTFGSGDNQIHWCPVSGGNVGLYVTDYAPYDLATDGANLYWTNYVPSTGTIAGCAVNYECKKPFTVASGQDSPYALAVTSKGVYWANAGDMTGHGNAAMGASLP